MLPIPRSRPAAGRMATGSISALPTLCSTPNNFLNMEFTSFLVYFVQTEAKKGMSNTAYRLFL
ncbi:hypothetical protein D3C74_405650 [compost metagenome]